jgi:TrmH family RNA methyltransferase
MNESAPVHSVQNSMVKHAFSLKNPKKIKDAEDFLCEGFHLVGEAFASGLNLRFIFATPEAQATDEGRKLFELSKKEKTRWIPVNSKIIAYVSDTTTPQGILAVAQKPAARWPSQPLSLILCLDRLQDAGNVGTLFRSAEAFGVQGVLLTEGCCDIFNPKVVRSSMGSIFRVPFQTSQSEESAMAWLKEQGVSSLALSGTAESLLWDLSLPKAVGLWVGSEGAGLSEDLMKACDARVKIPMQGKVESLNAGVAGSLALCVARQRLPFS